jgi:hypothetical protein
MWSSRTETVADVHYRAYPYQTCGPTGNEESSAPKLSRQFR